MARIRSIKPETWTDEKMVEMSPLARLLFIGLWNFADDDGRMVYSPTRIKLQIIPADSCDISALLGEIRGKLLIQVYAVDGIEYLQIVNFSKHQKVDKRTASKYPSPPALSAESPRITPPDQGRDQGRDQGKETPFAPDDSANRREPKKSRISFDPEKAAFQGIGEEDELRWQDAYPAVPIPPAIAQAASWLKANPANRKSNCERFLVNWFKREQDKAGRVSR